jgi:hypothetical protein
MDRRGSNVGQNIDRGSSRSICDGVGEQLQLRLRPDMSVPPHLQKLMNELRRRETGSFARSGR